MLFDQRAGLRLHGLLLDSSLDRSTTLVSVVESGSYAKAAGHLHKSYRRSKALVDEPARAGWPRGSAGAAVRRLAQIIQEETKAACKLEAQRG